MISIFYHIYQVNHWESIVNEQLTTVLESDIMENVNSLHLSVIGNSPITTSSFFKKYENRLVISYESENIYELPTLNKLLKFSKENDGYNILYFHTKGVTHKDDSTSVQDWRRYMDYWNITRWKDAIKVLKTYNVYGVNLVSFKQFHNSQPYYSGNFWWSKSEYLNTLHYLPILPTDNKTYDELQKYRGLAERMITSPLLLDTYYCAYSTREFWDGKRYIKGIHYI
jgi:hypothetical protein